jgi:Undecaprenyl-phosphate galactose phosphotransferase WbaP
LNSLGTWDKLLPIGFMVMARFLIRIQFKFILKVGDCQLGKNRNYLQRLGLIVLDAVVYVLAYVLTNSLFVLLGWESNLESLRNTGKLVNVGIPVSLVILSFLSRGLYSLKPYLIWEELHRIVKASLVAIVLIFFLLYFVRVSNITTAVLVSMGIFAVLISVARYQYRVILFKLGLLRTNVIIVGCGIQGVKFQWNVEAHPFTTYRVIGYVDDEAQDVNGVKVLGKLEDLPQILASQRVDEAVIAIPKGTRENFLDVMKSLEVKVRTIRFIPDMYGVLTFSPEITDFNRVLTISAAQGLLSPIRMAYKRTFDICFGLVGLVFLLPLYLVAAVFIKLDDGGKVIFTQKRIGLNGKPIQIYKFRTMVANAEAVLADLMAKDPAIKEAYERDKKLENDPRITKFGNILRKTSLDEFPQFLNVIKGEMSVVGPRPYLFGEIKDMGDKYDSIIKIKPGVTGLWQATGRNDITFDERVILDQYYVRNWTAWFDIVIIIRTLFSVAKRQGVKG